MSIGTNTNPPGTANTSIPQLNPSQFGLLGQTNSGFFSGLGSVPLGGFGSTGTTDGDFSSLFSSLNSSGTYGPGLYNNLGPAGSNPQAIALASEGASAASFALLNKLSPLDLQPESLYSSSAFGNQISGMSIFDTLSAVANGIAGTLPLSGRKQEFALALGPAIGALGGIFGLFRGLKMAINKPEVRTQSSQMALDEYQAEQENSEYV